MDYQAYSVSNFRKIPQLQGRDPDWVHQPFFARHDEAATWLNELKPAFGEKRFFFEDTLEKTYRENISMPTIFNYE